MMAFMRTNHSRIVLLLVELCGICNLICIMMSGVRFLSIAIQARHMHEVLNTELVHRLFSCLGMSNTIDTTLA